MSDKDNELNERPDETVTEAETTEAVETSDAAVESTTEAGTDATTHDTRGRSFLALFQGFPILGKLPITLVFHEAPTGTRK